MRINVSRSTALALAVAVSGCLLNAPAYGGSLEVAPSLETTPPEGQVSAQAAAPVKAMDVSGYAQWAAPASTLEMDGFGTSSLRSSFGNGVPLHIAISLIAPGGWQVFAQPGVSGAVPVTWKARREPWTDTLKRVLRQAGLQATVNWGHQAILLRVRPVPKVAPLDTKGYTVWGRPASALPASFHEGPGTVLSAPTLAGAAPVFLLNQGDLILTDLQKWAKQSGWTVVWQVPEDWQVPNTTTFSGDFQKAVSQVIQALSANGANVHAVFHTANNTVVISGAGGGE